MNFPQSIITLADSYKFSHYPLYPEDTKTIHSYLAPRGGEFEKVYFFGLTYYLKEYLSRPVTLPEIHVAKKYATKHGVPFNEEGWKYIVEQHGGKLPIIVRALPEGTIVGNKEPLITVENTDPKCAWLVSYLETLLLKIWYPTTVATKSMHVKDLLRPYWKKTVGDLGGLDFAFHNFGDRASSSVESAAIAGVAHLTQFKGTDNVNALIMQELYYDNKYEGFSICATEHSNVCSWRWEKEFDFYKHYITTYKDKPLIACVMDAYNIFEAVNYIASGEMKELIESKGGPKFIIRPDSGNPIEVLEQLINTLLYNDVAYTINSKGYLSFDKYGFIWGDGINPQQIMNIMEHFCNVFKITIGDKVYKLAASNFAFGSGGDLCQNVSRDTLKMAMKCSAIQIGEEWFDVFKNPVTDPGKASLKGRIEDPRFATVFENGKLINNQ